MSRPEAPTGAELAQEIREAVKARGTTLVGFLRPILGNSDPTRMLISISTSKKPRPITVSRIRALIDGADVPPKPRDLVARVQSEIYGRVDRAARIEQKPLPDFAADLVAMGLQCWEEEMGL